MSNKYTDEMVAALDNFASQYEDTIPYGDVTKFTEEFNEEFEVNFNQRSVGGKLRYMEYTLEKKGTVAGVKKYTEEEENTIREMCSDPDNLPFQEDVAEAVGRDCKSIGGKLVSMNIYGVLKRDKVVDDTVKLFTPEDEVKILELVDAPGDTFVEDIAEAVGKEVKQVRGKLAGMRIKGILTRNKVAKSTKIYTDELLAKIQVMLDEGADLPAIATEFSLKVTGLHSILAKKGMIAKSTKARFWTEERVDEFVGFVEACTARDAIAEIMGTTVAVIGKQAKALGLTLVEEKAA